MKARTLSRSIAAVAAAVSLAACAATPQQESTGQLLDDSVITTKVKAAFVSDATVSALRIGVDTQRGVVQLSGFAKSRAEADRADQIARAVPGVKEVRDDIVVQ